MALNKRISIYVAFIAYVSYPLMFVEYFRNWFHLYKLIMNIKKWAVYMNDLLQ